MRSQTPRCCASARSCSPQNPVARLCRRLFPLRPRARCYHRLRPELARTAVAKCRSRHPRHEELLPLADVVKASDEELEMLTGCTEIEAGAKEFFKLGVQAAVITRGAKGLRRLHPENHLNAQHLRYKKSSIPPAPATASSARSHKAHGDRQARFRRSTKPSCATLPDFANAAGSVCATKKRCDSCARRPRIDRNVQSVYPAFKAVSHFPAKIRFCTAAARSY